MSGPIQSNKGRSKMSMPNDFFARRLAAIEEEKAAQAHADRFNQSIPLIVDCIKQMRLAELSGEGNRLHIPSRGRRARQSTVMTPKTTIAHKVAKTAIL